jgi:hypothetical protein
LPEIGPAILIEQAQLILGFGMALLGGASVPLHRVGRIGDDALATDKQLSKPVLRLAVSGCGGL